MDPNASESRSGEQKHDADPMDVDTQSTPANTASAGPGTVSNHVVPPSSSPSKPYANQNLPCDDGFIPDISQISLNDDQSQRYWEEVLSRCSDETRLNTSTPGTRDVFAFGNVVIKSDHHATEPTGDYSAMDENESAAVKLLADVLSDIQLPQCYLKRKIQGRDILIQSRVLGTTLQAAWPHLSREQKVGFKNQARNIIGRIHKVKSNRSKPSYIVETNNPRISHKLQQDEYDMLFENESDNDSFAAAHNNMVPANILVDNDRIVGVVGWSNAGYFNWDRVKDVHSTLRCENSSEIDESGSDVPWHDLYDIPANHPENSPNENGRSNSSVNIKTEVPNPSLEAVPRASGTDVASMSGELPTPKKITDLKRESISRGPSSERSSPSPSVKGPKKRAAPSSTTKKGAATRKTAPKKRKLNGAASIDGSNASRRGSLTPAVSRPGKASAQRQLKQSSLSVASSPVPDDKVLDGVGGEGDDDDDDDEDVDPTELFCICRKPDNHTWMIGCDGGCEDWFHGKCVNMKQADADLIDKYICPSCETKYGTHTTWKPMCRLPVCRQPARVNARPPSKYCSDEHGREFMRLKLNGGTSRSNSRAPRNGPGARSRASSSGLGKGRYRGSYADGGEEDGSNDDYEDEEDDLEGDDAEAEREGGADGSGSRGGILTKSDLKAAISLSNSAEEFRKLGESVLTSQPPDIKSRFGDADNAIDQIDFDQEAQNIEFTTEERQQLQKLRDEKSRLRNYTNMLGDRDKFVTLVRHQAKHILERLRQTDPKGATTWKDICGFDPRLSWSDEEFDEWRQSEDGKRQLSGSLDPPESTNREIDNNGDTEMADGSEDNVGKIAGVVCLKRRCEQHKQWFKVQQQDILFERSSVKDHLAKCEKKAKEVIERVVIRIYGDDTTVDANNTV